MKKIVEHELNIPSDYQYKALREGRVFQRQWHRNRLILIESLGFIHQEDCIADAGCGSGNTIYHFHGQAKSIVGLDYNEKSLEFIKGKLKEKGITNASVHHHDLLTPPPEKLLSSFDKIILNEVIEHFDEKDVHKIIDNLNSMLKPGGEILVTTPNYRFSPWPLLEGMVDKYHLYPSLWGEQHKIKFDRRKLREIFAGREWEIERAGTFSLFSPLAAVLGQSFADAVMRLETRFLRWFGPQLFIVAKKTSKSLKQPK